MALQQNLLISKTGATVDNAYIRFHYAQWSKEWDQLKPEGSLQFTVYASEQAFLDGKEMIDFFEIPAGTILQNIEQLAYVELKKHPDYLDAVDVV